MLGSGEVPHSEERSRSDRMQWVLETLTEAMQGPSASALAQANVSLEPKHPDVPFFDDKPAHLQDWLDTCDNFFRVQTIKYSTEQRKIAYAISRLSVGGRASQWVTPYNRVLGLERVSWLSDWKEFCGMFCIALNVKPTRTKAAESIKELR